MTKLMFEPHKISKQKLRAIHDHVLVHEMVFDERLTTGGIVLLNDNGKGYGIRPRWGKVYAIGPAQETVKVGDWVMVAHGRWTRGIEVVDEDGEQTLRRIDPKDILMISTDSVSRPSDESMSTAVHIEKQER